MHQSITSRNEYKTLDLNLPNTNMRYISFAPQTTVLTIPASEVKTSLTERNNRPAVALCGSKFQENTKRHDGGRSPDPLPAAWVRAEHEGRVFYFHAATGVSTYAHPVAVSGATWSNAVRRRRRFTAAAKRSASKQAD